MDVVALPPPSLSFLTFLTITCSCQWQHPAGSRFVDPTWTLKLLRPHTVNSCHFLPIRNKDILNRHLSLWLTTKETVDPMKSWFLGVSFWAKTGSSIRKLLSWRNTYFFLEYLALVKAEKGKGFRDEKHSLYGLVWLLSCACLLLSI